MAAVSAGAWSTFADPSLQRTALSLIRAASILLCRSPGITQTGRATPSTIFPTTARSTRELVPPTWAGWRMVGVTPESPSTMCSSSTTDWRSAFWSTWLRTSTTRTPTRCYPKWRACSMCTAMNRGSANLRSRCWTWSKRRVLSIRCLSRSKRPSRGWARPCRPCCGSGWVGAPALAHRLLLPGRSAIFVIIRLGLTDSPRTAAAPSSTSCSQRATRSASGTESYWRRASTS